MADRDADALVIEELPRSDLDVLEPLWTALHDHHRTITPRLGHAGTRDDAAAWRKRRSKYELWHEDPRTFVLLARRGGRPVGYACVTVGPGYASWTTGEDIAELETLSVLPDERGRGVGTALVDAVEDRLRGTGVTELSVTSAVTNVDSHRFYERRGLGRTYTVFFGSFENRDGPPHELPVLSGERVTLRPLATEDVETLLPAVYEPGIAEWWGDTSDPDYQREGFRNDGHAFAIDLDGELAGWLAFHEETEPDYRQVALDIMLLPRFQGRRLGPDALRTAIRWFVDARDHHRFTIDPSAENHRAIAAYESVGFRPVGILRQSERAPDGHWRDSLLLDLVAADLRRPRDS